MLGGVAAALLAAAPALCQAQAAPERGLYIGGSVGQMEAEGTCPAGTSCDLKDTGWKLFGGYRFTRHLAAEGTYARWGEINLSTGGVSVTGELESIGVAALGILPLGQSFELFGKIGFLSTDQKFRATGPGINVSGFEDGNEGHYGVGAVFKATSNLGVRLEWEQLSKSDVTFFSLGLQYRF